MIVAVACDHGGLTIKSAVVEAVKACGHEVLDLGTHSTERVDYPDFAEKAGLALQQGKADRAVAICSSGVGVCITLNKMKGVYAAICHDTYSAHQGVEHDNMNALCLGGQIIGPQLAYELVTAFLKAGFFNEGRYKQRTDKILAIEKRETRTSE
ncbi:MAG: RpiB/LacA/LacB family sugar-phosphate isomerase [Anaerolineae bacterium]|nr:RpiB/LacA/LacB family sugar-phosphate isomerase [Anaerolineae bacterium]